MNVVKQWWHKLVDGPQPPDITPMLEEGERERIRAAQVVQQMEQERLRRQQRVRQATSWEDLLGTGTRR